MYSVAIIVSLIFLAGTGYGERGETGERGEKGERCKCNRIHHPQDEFCNSDYAMRVIILAGVPSPLPGERDYGFMYNKYMEYLVYVVESFKQDVFEEQVINVYSPRRGICGKTGLMNTIIAGGTDEYLFVGDIIQTKRGDQVLVITNCNWVEPWEDLTVTQIRGLRTTYHDCSCLAPPVSGPMEIGETDADKFSYDGCLFNPVKAQVLNVDDCETLNGFCIRQHTGNNTCRWANTGAFRSCFETRKDRLDASAGAVTTREGCKLYTGRKKKQCLLKLLKNRNAGRTYGL